MLALTLATCELADVIHACRFRMLSRPAMNIYLFGWVAVQYHWILDESVQYLGESKGRAKYKHDESNVQ